MKRIFCVVLVLCMSICVFTACGGDASQTTSGGAAATTGTAAEQTTVATTEVTTAATTEAAILFELNRKDITLVTKGETLDLYSGDIDRSSITWSSKDTSVATFSDGIVTAVGKGQTEVSAIYDGQVAVCIVRCNLKDVPATQEPTQPSQDNPVTTGGKRDPVKQPPAATVPASFFDDAVFMGDSVSLKLSYYAASSGELGKAKFLVVGSYGVANAINDHPDTKLSFQGTTYTDFEKALAATGSKKLFVMFGMNDIGLYGIDGTIANWGKFIGMVRDACPDMKIYIQSMTPVWTGGEKGGLKNPNVDAYNVKLKAFAQSNGCTFIDVAPYMKDSTGGLATIYCSDSFVHLSTEGAKAWVKVLRAFAY